MFETVFHPAFGKGALLSRTEVLTEVEFNSGIKTFLNDYWGKYLFLTEEDMSCNDKSALQVKYLEYLPKKVRAHFYNESDKSPLIEAINCDELADDIDELNEIALSLDNWMNEYGPGEIEISSLCNQFKVLDFNGQPVRKVMIIYNNRENRNTLAFLKIIGFDCTTGKTILIVDTNGVRYGLHTYKEDISKLESGTIIEAEFQLVKDTKYINAFRIKSDYQEIDRVPLKNLYHEQKAKHRNIVRRFDEILAFSEMNRGKVFYTLAHFNGTQMCLHKNKYQIKMENKFVDVLDTIKAVSENINLFYRGWALLVISHDTNNIKAIKLFGKFVTEQGANAINKQNKKSSTMRKYNPLEDNSEESDTPEPFWVDIYPPLEEEYDDFEDYNNYDELMPDVMDEYSEYYTEEDANRNL